MITEQQHEQASLYALGALTPDEQRRFEAELASNVELREEVRSLQRTAGIVATGTTPVIPLPAGLKAKVLRRIDERQHAKRSAEEPAGAAAMAAGLSFVTAADQTGWKALPIPGAWIKLLSFEPKRGFAVLLGKLDPGVRYPAHTNAGPEDFYILTGDLQVSGRALKAGDFHHADAGSMHGENYSIEGCTLLAVLTTDDPLVQFAMA